MILSSEQSALVQQIFTHFSPTQLHWLSGYISGKLDATNIATSASAINSTHQAVEAPATLSAQLTILYGSQSGNSKKVAQQAFQLAQDSGFNARLLSMSDYKVANLKNETHLWLIVSTHGEGVPPAAAEELYDFLHSKKAPKLPNLHYAILALGDKSYINYCQTGVDFDTRLDALGAKRLVQRTDCDVNFADTAKQWLTSAHDTFAPLLFSADTAQPKAALSPQTATVASNAPLFDRNKPLTALVAQKIKLNARGSQKETYHLELSLEDSGLTYEPGDALGIYTHNPIATINAILQHTQFNPDTMVEVAGTTLSLQTALAQKLEITTLSRDVIERYNAHLQNTDLAALLANNQALAKYLYGRDVLDLLIEYPFTLSEQYFVDLLRSLAPRLYSISSSLEACPNEVHLTIAAVRYQHKQRQRLGSCSTFAADTLQINDTVQVFVEPNELFKLPNNPNTPIIMIGPGTGVAPFRAFMQQREATENTAKSWLFFGDQHFTTDFLYQTEWQRHLKNGTLTRLDVAFSRDTEQKVYVQHKMLQHATELFAWIEQGAHIYVCGDRVRMARDVQQALVAIVQQQKNIDADDALQYVKQLRHQKRYLEDVYW